MPCHARSAVCRRTVATDRRRQAGEHSFIHSFSPLRAAHSFTHPSIHRTYTHPHTHPHTHTHTHTASHDICRCSFMTELALVHSTVCRIVFTTRSTCCPTVEASYVCIRAAVASAVTARAVAAFGRLSATLPLCLLMSGQHAHRTVAALSAPCSRPCRRRRVLPASPCHDFPSGIVDVVSSCGAVAAASPVRSAAM